MRVLGLSRQCFPHSLYLSLHSAPNMNSSFKIRSCSRLYRLNDRSDTCSLTGDIIVTAFSEFISFDFESNLCVDANMREGG